MPQGSQQFGQFLGGLGERDLQSRRMAIRAESLRRKNQEQAEISNEFMGALNDPTLDENKANISRARLQARILGSPMMEINEKRYAADVVDNVFNSRLAARTQKRPETLQGYEDIRTPKGGTRRIARFGTSPEEITRLQDLNLGEGEGSDGMSEYQRASLELRRQQMEDRQNGITDQKNVLDAEKRGLESKLIPMLKSYTYTKTKKDASGNDVLDQATGQPIVEKSEPADLRKVLVGEHQPYGKEVGDWLEKIGKSEALARANGIAFTPAAALAWKQLHPDKDYPDWIKQQMEPGGLVANKSGYKASPKGEVTAPAKKQRPFNSVEEFKSAFKKKQGREPSATELQRANGKYY